IGDLGGDARAVWNAERERAGTRPDEQRVHVPVVAADELEDPLPPCRRARQAHGAHGRFGTGAHQAHLLHARQRLDAERRRLARPTRDRAFIDVTNAQRSAPSTTLERHWRDVLARVLLQSTEHATREILRRLRLRAVTPAQVVVEAPNRLVLVCVNDHYLGKLQEAVAAVMGARQVVLEVATREQGELFPGMVPKRAERRSVAVGTPLSPRYTFDTFVV